MQKDINKNLPLPKPRFENTKEVDDIVLKEINKRLRINNLENIEKHFSLYNF